MASGAGAVAGGYGFGGAANLSFNSGVNPSYGANGAAAAGAGGATGNYGFGGGAGPGQGGHGAAAAAGSYGGAAFGGGAGGGGFGCEAAPVSHEWDSNGLGPAAHMPDPSLRTAAPGKPGHATREACRTSCQSPRLAQGNRSTGSAAYSLNQPNTHTGQSAGCYWQPGHMFCWGVGGSFASLCMLMCIGLLLRLRLSTGNSQRGMVLSATSRFNGGTPAGAITQPL